MVSTEVAIEGFSEIIERHSKRVEDGQLELIVDRIDRLMQQNPAVYDERAVAGYLKERSERLKGLVEEYFTDLITDRFPLLSDKLFGLKRHLTLVNQGRTWRVVRDDTKAELENTDAQIKTIPPRPEKPKKPDEPDYEIEKKLVTEEISPGRKRIRIVPDTSAYRLRMGVYEKNMHIYKQQVVRYTKLTREWEAANRELEKRKESVRRIEVPLFAYTPLFDGKHTANLASFTRQKGSSSDDYYTRTRVTIEAKLPGSIGPNLKDAYRDALSYYFSVLSEMFTSPVAGDIMYAEGNLAQPEVGAIWIPTPESLSVSVDEKLIQKRKDLDPAMILRVRGKNYLVQTWRVDDEQPFEHYLREYSIGDLRGKL